MVAECDPPLTPPPPPQPGWSGGPPHAGWSPRSPPRAAPGRPPGPAQSVRGQQGVRSYGVSPCPRTGSTTDTPNTVIPPELLHTATMSRGTYTKSSRRTDEKSCRLQSGKSSAVPAAPTTAVQDPGLLNRTAWTNAAVALHHIKKVSEGVKGFGWFWYKHG